MTISFADHLATIRNFIVGRALEEDILSVSISNCTRPSVHLRGGLDMLRFYFPGREAVCTVISAAYNQYCVPTNDVDYVVLVPRPAEPETRIILADPLGPLDEKDVAIVV